MKIKVNIILLTLVVMCVSCSRKVAYSSKSLKDKFNFDIKKGMCLTTTKENNWVETLNAMNISWHYSWGGRINPDEPQNIQFVPMIWKAAGNFTDLDQNIDYLKPLVKSQKIHYLLGFNEPDGEKQANMTVDEAIAAWPKLMELGVPLGSPACVHADNDWMKKFITKASEQHYRVDFITVHWYGGPNVAEFIGYLKKIHKMYHKPIWITEFAVGDWKAKTVAENKFSPDEVLAFMKNLLPQLDKLSFVEKYAWFSAKPNSPHLGTSALFNSNGTLTALGKYYSSY
jgi:hypothetical protein